MRLLADKIKHYITWNRDWWVGIHFTYRELAYGLIITEKEAKVIERYLS
jgi:hypothetical protein